MGSKEASEKKEPKARKHEHVRVGGWCKVEAGAYNGVIGALLGVDDDGRALVRARDHNGPHHLIDVDYDDLRTTPFSGGR